MRNVSDSSLFSEKKICQYGSGFIKILKEYKTNVHIFIMSRLVLLRMRNVSDESSKYDRGGQATDDNNIRRMRIACRLPNVTHTHSEYVILISFPQQKMDARTRLNITLIRTLSLVLFYPKTIVCHLTDDIPPRV